MVPYFDATPEDTDLYSIPQVFRKTVPVTPLQPAQKAPVFSIVRQRTIGQYVTWQTDYSPYIHLHDWLQNGPLVVAFYSSGWNRYAENYVAKLTDLQAEVRRAGGTLLVLSPDSVDSLQTLAEQQELSLTLAQDRDNHIANQFGVHSADDLVWNRIAGITEDVPFPALFVIGQNRQVLFSYLDKDFTEEFPAAAILESLRQQAKVGVVALYDRSAA